MCTVYSQMKTILIIPIINRRNEQNDLFYLCTNGVIKEHHG